MTPSITLRHDLRPGDLGAVVQMHGLLYAREYGFDSTFEAYVAGPMADFVRSRTERDCLWLAELEDRLVGSIAIVGLSEQEAQLRWFLVDPCARGRGLGKRLLEKAIAFSKGCDYRNILLWTVSTLTIAANLYRSAGFVLVKEKPGRHWGVDLVEEKYVLSLT